jgi:parvulin-like peptidyl-prolyl isomerase
VDGKTVYSEAEKKAAYDALVAIQKEWQDNGGTVEAFEALAKEKTDDTGSKDVGGLYEDVFPGQMVTNFNDWCFAEEREPGNYEIVETEYGYHLLYFVAKQENTYRQLMIEDALRGEKYTTWYNEQQEAATVTVLDTKYLTRDYVIENH